AGAHARVLRWQLPFAPLRPSNARETSSDAVYLIARHQDATRIVVELYDMGVTQARRIEHGDRVGGPGERDAELVPVRRPRAVDDRAEECRGRNDRPVANRHR